jgi:hypothetical protein
MTIGANVLNSVRVRASTLFLMKYDQLSQSILPLFAATLPKVDDGEIQYYEWWTAFPRMREWVGERKSMKTFASRIEVQIKSYEETFSYSLRKARMDGDRLMGITPEELAAKMTESFVNGKLLEAFEPLRQNALTTYDDQNIFDTDHEHPDGTTFSNVIDLSDVSASRSTTGYPTIVEAANELQLAEARLLANRMKVATVREVPATPPLAVIVRSAGTKAGYHELLTQDFLSTDRLNRWKGRFTLIEDTAPVSGTEKKVDVIDTTPGGPRPTVHIASREPGPIKMDMTREFDTETVRYGNDADYGFAAALPQPAVRIQE